MSHIVGLDLSLTASGLACACGQVKLIGRDGVTKLPLTERVEVVRLLAEAITDWTDDHTPGERSALRFPAMVVVEQPAFSKSGGGAVERHALWWSVVATLIGYGHSVAVAPPTTLKLYALGKGSGKGTQGKGPMVDALARRLPMFETGGDDNIVDAAWLAAMGADHLGVPLVEMPAANRAALVKVAWPEVS
jgi:crossover junction endodeoxyribonuclease RuvC